MTNFFKNLLNVRNIGYIIKVYKNALRYIKILLKRK